VKRLVPALGDCVDLPHAAYRGGVAVEIDPLSDESEVVRPEIGKATANLIDR
jgi:hypothetical protein